mmetsp:Transcript_20930/g.48622  ORF Transcript_20930/g.48622 Transcript_20930/m.48622 type:complete len:561 (-) Transcript_20930:9-1691(-)|eukprot:CAMPEP_0171066456 /NCGR_PEP_ID=MMETSP0766_2-20121228/7430_1 /TAXON_ID=439317 /ORGANISM="Gambierdiscus australes, Strain CAWD 149" /LENGTH=560 /DNA_ID=CAMNT_0011522631 /DNA_START=74 /DNA_END=1756 /DNA_ORIENTATION=-
MACYHSRAFVALVLALGLGGCSASTGARFRGGRVEGSDRTVATQDVEASLRMSMELAFQGGNGVAARQLARIEAGMWRTFQSLPKNAMGRLAPRAVRYIIHSYFGKEHGWLIKGLEPHGMQLSNMTEVHDVSILQDKAPALVEALLEARRSGRGLSLGDVVAMAAALERLIFDESLALLEASYFLNGLSAGSLISEDALHEVLSSYLLLFEMGARGNLSDVARHKAVKAKVAKAGGSWLTLVDFEQDAMHNFQFSQRDHMNPFVRKEYSFQEAAQIIEDLAQGYGKWQNMECRQMKDQLMGLDLDGTGRVPLSSFYSQPETADYQFTESVDYLRQIGALDEAEGSKPLVRIANYMTGPSNCIASSSYYSVCCLSDCEGLMNDLEGKVRAPTASPEQLLSLVGNLSAAADRPLAQGLEEKLRSISDRHGGSVPLHGRLFAQWMHFAFPSECPFPQVSEDAAALTPSHWLDKKATASKEVRQQHVEIAGGAPAAAEPLQMQWSDDEVLPLQEPQRHGRGTFGTFAQAGVQLLLLLVLLRTIVAYAAGYAGRPKKEGLELPLR